MDPETRLASQGRGKEGKHGRWWFPKPFSSELFPKEGWEDIGEKQDVQVGFVHPGAEKACILCQVQPEEAAQLWRSHRVQAGEAGKVTTRSGLVDGLQTS